MMEAGLVRPLVKCAIRKAGMLGLMLSAIQFLYCDEPGRSRAFGLRISEPPPRHP
jgi:hypothetical protein